jgi:tripartite-type tricarboxylate transporter receptor subunit TctC
MKSSFAGSSSLSWVVAGLVVGEAFAQAPAAGYPSKPIRVVIGFPAGGAADIQARLIAPKFQETYGQPWVIDNRPGASGIIGTEVAAKTAPDGYNLLMFTGSHTVHPSIYKSLPFDITKNFTPVTLISVTTMVLVVHPTVPARSVKELIALAKASPGRLNFASDGVGSAAQMSAELFKSIAGINIVGIQYKGGPPSVAATVGGEVDLVFATMPTVVQQIKSGKVRALAVGNPTRSAIMPELPTVAEAALPGYEVTNATGMLAPAGTPREIVVKLQQEIGRIVKLPDIRERLIGLGVEPVGNTPEEFGEYIRSEIAKWARVVKAAGIVPQPW